LKSGKWWSDNCSLTWKYDVSIQQPSDIYPGKVIHCLTKAKAIEIVHIHASTPEAVQTLQLSDIAPEL